MTADHILRTQGMTGDQLLKLGYQAANTYAKQRAMFDYQRLDDLAQHCVMTVLRRAPTFRADLTNFDQAKNPSSTPFKSWAWMQMEKACIDWNRRRSEGFAGRAGRDKVFALELTATPEDFNDASDIPDEIEFHLSETREQRWNDAARLTGWSVSDWAAITLDRAANDLLERSAA